MSLEGKSPEEIEALAALADSVMSNPKTRLPFQRALKQANPHISVPELEIEDRIAAVAKPHIDKVAELEAREAQRNAQSAANVLFENLRDEGVVKSRKAFEELVKYAAEKGFNTNEQGLRMAASHRADELTPAEPTPHPGAIDLSQREQNKDLLSNPQGWARNTATQAIDELNGRRKSA